VQLLHDAGGPFDAQRVDDRAVAEARSARRIELAWLYLWDRNIPLFIPDPNGA
jgi:hypothetical protein